MKEEFNIKKIIETALENKDAVKIREIFDLIPTIDIAEALIDEDDAKKLIYIFRVVPKDNSALFFTELTDSQQQLILKYFTDKELLTLLENSFADDIVDTMQDLPANLVNRILRVAPPELRKNINQLLNYKDNTAGSVMTTEFIEMRENVKVKDALSDIRQRGKGAETIYTIFVKDASRTLIGIIDLDDLIFAKDDEQLQDIMNKDFVTCNVNDDQEEVANKFKRYDLNAMAVVNDENKIIGIITIDDIVDIIVKEANEDISNLNQVGNNDKPYLQTPIFKIVMKCVPWIIVLMILQIGTASITSAFDGIIAKFSFLAIFSPLILDAGGNSGGQTTTMIVRSLAMDEFKKGDFKKVVFKELRVAAIIALIVGIFAFGWTLFEMTVLNMGDFSSIKGDGSVATSTDIIQAKLLVAALIAISLMVTMILSRLIGCCLPFLAKLIHVDPAVMCAPFTTTVVDVVSLFTYFIIWQECFMKIVESV